MLLSRTNLLSNTAMRGRAAQMTGSIGGVNEGSATRRYWMSAEVRKRTGAELAARLTAGAGVPAVYSCMICDQPGDATRVDTSIILIPGDRGDIVGFAHTTCSPSRIGKMPAIDADRAAAGTGEPPASAPDMYLAWYGAYAALVCDEPPSPLMLTGGGDGVNLMLGTWLTSGFAIATMAPPPVVTGWTAHLTGDTLTGVRTPGGWWWQADAKGAATVLPAEWVASARGHGLIAVLAGDIRLDGGTPLHAALNTAVRDGRVVYGLVAVA